MTLRIALAGLSALALAAPAMAQDWADQGPGAGLLSEFRAGVLFHSVDEPTGVNASRLHDVNFELLFASPDLEVFSWIGAPRPHVGVTANLAGLESMAYFGLSWTWQVFDSPVFVEASFGGALHDGLVGGATYPARDLGCNFMFRESASIGVNVTAATSVMATVEHASHAGLCGPDNRGLTNLGLRLGHKF